MGIAGSAHIIAVKMGRYLPMTKLKIFTRFGINQGTYMRNKILISFLFLTLVTSPVFALDAVTKVVIDHIIKNRLEKLNKAPSVISAVKEANQQESKTILDLIELENRWRNDDNALINSVLDNSCAKLLKEFQSAERYNRRSLYMEIFVMDKLGNIIASTNKTSDYWQGDEAKFYEAFNNGQGKNFVDKPSFDDSTQSYLIQVSLPINDPETKTTIGAITCGISMNSLPQYKRQEITGKEGN